MPIRTVVVNSLRHQFNIVVQTTLSKIIIGGIVIQQTDLKPRETPRELLGDLGARDCSQNGLQSSQKGKCRQMAHITLSPIPCQSPLTK